MTGGAMLLFASILLGFTGCGNDFEEPDDATTSAHFQAQSVIRQQPRNPPWNRP